MSERQQYEKHEKTEKPDEKQEEKGHGEKWQRDPVSGAVWAAILIWAGVVLLAATLGFLDRFWTVEAPALIFLGAGAIIFGGAIYRLLVPSYRQPVTGSIILAIIFVAIGLGGIVGWGAVGPLALVLIGIYLLLRGLFGRG
jgi:hypothetical protein